LPNYQKFTGFSIFPNRENIKNAFRLAPKFILGVVYMGCGREDGLKFIPKSQTCGELVIVPERRNSFQPANQWLM
jgi:hypothetical protein